MGAEPAVSVVIACYKQVDFLDKVLLSLTRQSFSDFELVIADDGSGPDLAACLQKYQSVFRHPIQHCWHEDNGFRKTIIVNRAVASSRGAYLIFIDADCILHHRFVERHYKRRRPETVLSGRRIMLNEAVTAALSDEDISSGRFEKPWFWWNHTEKKERNRGFYLPLLFRVVNKKGKTYWAFGSNFSLFKADFIAVNGYDETILGRGMEDINLSSRLTLQGYPILKLTHEALQYHQFHRSGPVPHDEETMYRLAHPEDAYASVGIRRHLDFQPMVSNQ